MWKRVSIIETDPSADVTTADVPFAHWNPRRLAMSFGSSVYTNAVVRE